MLFILIAVGIRKTRSLNGIALSVARGLMVRMVIILCIKIRRNNLPTPFGFKSTIGYLKLDDFICSWLPVDEDSKCLRISKVPYSMEGWKDGSMNL